MSHVRQDTYARPTTWAQHLKPEGKRRQSKRERLAAKSLIRKEEREAA